MGHTWLWFMSALLADFGLNPLCCSVPTHGLTCGWESDRLTALWALIFHCATHKQKYL